jgi:hypothetical protein
MSMFARSREMLGAAGGKQRSEPESDRDTTVDSEDEYGRALTPSTTDVESDCDRRLSEKGSLMGSLIISQQREGTVVHGSTRRLKWPPSARAEQRSLQIWDWDDTLFPSTWLNGQGLRLEDDAGAAPEQQVLLDAIAAEVEQTIRLALQTGEVVIVTNAEHGWVDQSCRKFCPTLHPLVDTLRVVSARSTYEEFGVFSPLEWKVKAFEREMGAFVPKAARLAHQHEVANLMSIGDSIHEREALLRASETMHYAMRRVKTVKLPERPDLPSLHKTHELLRKQLRTLVEHDGDLDLVVNPHAQQLQLYQF